MNKLSSKSCFPLSAASAAHGWLSRTESCMWRGWRGKLVTSIPRFLPQLCVCLSLMVASLLYMDSLVHGLWKFWHILHVLDVNFVFQFLLHQGQFVHFSSESCRQVWLFLLGVGVFFCVACISLKGCVTPCLHVTKFSESVPEEIIRFPMPVIRTGFRSGEDRFSWLIKHVPVALGWNSFLEKMPTHTLELHLQLFGLHD